MMQIIINNAVGGGTGLPGSGGGTPFSNTYSLDFDGVDDYVGTNSKIIGSDITLSGWVNFNGGSYTGNAPQFPLSITPSNTQVDNETLGRFYKSGRGMEITIQCYDQTGGNYSTYSVRSFDFEGAGWQHVCWTYNVTTKHIYVYLNGVSQTWTNFGGTITTPYLTAVGTRLYESDLTIGRVRPISASGTYLGLVDEVSTYNRILTQEEITSISSEPTDLTDLSPTVWYRMGDNGAYKSPQWLLPNNENKDKVSNYSFEFDGVDDYIDCGNISELNGVTEASWSIWASKGDTSDDYLMSCYSATSSLQQYLFHQYADKLYIYLSDSGGTLRLMNRIDYTFNIDEWYHIGIVYNESEVSNADKVKVYVNGTLQTNQQTGFALTSLRSTTASTNIGRATDFTTKEYGGKIDEVAVFNSAISIGDVLDGSGLPIDVSSVSGIVSYYKMGEEANFTSNWLVDNSALTNYSKRSFDFDGVDDRVQLSSDFVASGEFTVSFWMKPVSAGTPNGEIYPIGTFPGNENYIKLDQISVLWLRLGATTVIFNEAVYGAGANNLVLNDWQNIVFIRDSSNVIRCYRNGVDFGYNVAAATNSNTLTLNSFGRIITNTFGYKGGLDEIAFWNSDETANLSTIYNGGEPTTLPSGAVAHWRMGEEASFNGTNWTIPDNIGTNNGTSNAMTVDDLVGEAPNYSGGGISNAMTIEDRVGNAPNSDNNALSYNMESVDRTTDVPT